MTETSNPVHCPHCGFGHIGTCPRIKVIEYFENGAIKRIEFHGYEPPSLATMTPPPTTTLPPWGPSNMVGSGEATVPHGLRYPNVMIYGGSA